MNDSITLLFKKSYSFSISLGRVSNDNRNIPVNKWNQSLNFIFCISYSRCPATHDKNVPSLHEFVAPELENSCSFYLFIFRKIE